MSPPRIVSLLPSATEIVCAVGLEQNLIGVSHECDFPASVVVLPKVTRSLINHAATSAEIDRQVSEQLSTGSALYSLDAALLAELRPHLIVTQSLCSVCAVSEDEVQSAIAALPEPPQVITLHPQRLADLFDALRSIATAAGVSLDAERVISRLTARIDAVQTRSEAVGSPRRRVAILEWLDPPFSSGHWNPELVRLAGGVEVLGQEGKPSRRLSWKEVIDARPEVVLIACCGYDLDATMRDVAQLPAVPGWLELPAVKNGRVYVSDGSQYFNRPGPRLVDSLEILAHAVAPDDHPPPQNAPAAQRIASGFWRTMMLVLGFCLGILNIAGNSGCARSAKSNPDSLPSNAEPVLKTYSDQMGCLFTEPEKAPLDAVAAESIPVPEFPGRWAIWSSSGRDHRGHVWFGVSAQGAEPPSAHLFEYNPATRKLTDRGNVVEALRRAGVYKPGEGQMKIHSRIVQGDDGHLYFASYDEQGEATDGSRLPTWGSHFWRLRLPENRWEHLFAAPEALIAVAGAGRWMYALGYFGHVLYQYDCATGKHRSVTVGSLGGHISRNFFCDFRGHAYVPRLRGGIADQPATTYLVELDTDLKEQAATRFEFYSQTPNDSSHGITGVQPLADGTIVFTTDQGFLFRVTPLDVLPAKVEPLGWFHPSGKAYVASLFTSDGKSHVMGYCYHVTPEAAKNEWLIFDLESRTSKAVPFSLPEVEGQAISNHALYGSITRDNDGACYLVGLHRHNVPIILRVFRP